EALEDALDGYDGTVILVSHDRELLRGVTTRTWVLRGGRITDYAGGFADWEAAEVERSQRQSEEWVARADQRGRERAEARRGIDERRAAQSRARTARRALDAAELEAREAEARVAALKSRLEDPDLYNRPDAAALAGELSRAVDSAVSDLETALERWARAAEVVDEAERAAAG